MDSTKRDLRLFFRQSRQSQPVSRDWNLLFQTPEFTNAKVVASYHSYGQEPDTTEINSTILSLKKSLLLPRVNNDSSLSWIQWDGDSENLVQRQNILEPSGMPFTGKIDLIITPALAIDIRGNRLGQGGGIYDRALAQSEAWKVALINDHEFVSDILPVESHDQRVDAVVTPTRIMRF